MELLGDDELATALQDLQWERQGDALVKVVSTRDHPDPTRYLDAVHERARVANHHPDIEVGDDQIVLRLTTHDAGGLTQRDVDLAAAIDLLDVGH